MDVVERIQGTATDGADRPSEPITITSLALSE